MGEEEGDRKVTLKSGPDLMASIAQPEKEDMFTCIKEIPSTWVNLENKMLSEKSQTQKTVCYVIPFI